MYSPAHTVPRTTRDQPEGGLGSAPAWNDDLNGRYGGFGEHGGRSENIAPPSQGSPSCPDGLVCWPLAVLPRGFVQDSR